MHELRPVPSLVPSPAPAPAPLTFQQEPWREMWPQGRVLAEAHFEEVGPQQRKRPFSPDESLIATMEFISALRIYTARRGGSLLGYIMWQLMPDVECRGLRSANMGPWYMSPGHPHVAHGLFHYSLFEMKKAGVEMADLHHRLQGRGKGLGRFFQRLGARPSQHHYSLWLGDL